jgi:predicted GNAT family acetyltransferase
MPTADGSWWLAREAGKTIGFVAFSDVGHNTAYLSRAGVCNAYRGKGIYGKLIAAGLADWKARGFTHCVSDCTTTSWSSARGLIAAGFKPFWPAAPWALPTSIYWIKEL